MVPHLCLNSDPYPVKITVDGSPHASLILLLILLETVTHLLSQLLTSCFFAVVHETVDSSAVQLQWHIVVVGLLIDIQCVTFIHICSFIFMSTELSQN